MPSLRHAFVAAFHVQLFRARLAYLGRTSLVSELGDDAQVIGQPRLMFAKNSELRIGARSILRSRSDSNPIGVDNPITFCTLSPGARIVIGSNVGISGGSVCARELVQIGNDTLIGANTYIFDNDFHPVDSAARLVDDRSVVRTAPVMIGSNVFIGARSIVLKGVSIGDNAVIGAGSVVTQSIPANAIAAGNPCRILRV